MCPEAISVTAREPAHSRARGSQLKVRASADAAPAPPRRPQGRAAGVRRTAIGARAAPASAEGSSAAGAIEFHAPQRRHRGWRHHEGAAVFRVNRGSGAEARRIQPCLKGAPPLARTTHTVGPRPPVRSRTLGRLKESDRRQLHGRRTGGSEPPVAVRSARTPAHCTSTTPARQRATSGSAGAGMPACCPEGCRRAIRCRGPLRPVRADTGSACRNRRSPAVRDCTQPRKQQRRLR